MPSKVIQDRAHDTAEITSRRSNDYVTTYKKIRPDAVNATSGRIFIVYSIKIPYVITPYRRSAGFVIRRQKRFDLLKPWDL